MKPAGKNFAVEALALAAVLVLIILLYWPTLDGGWNFDDLGHIVNNPAIRLDSLSPGALARALTGPLPNRPLAYLSFALDYWRAGDFDPRAFHVTNLAIHLAAVVAAWIFLRLLLAAPVFKLPWPRAAALVGAAVFGLHPVQFQSVAYVVQRMNLLAGLFTLIALGLWLYGRGRAGRARAAGFIGAGLAAALGLLCKETAAGLALLLPALDLCLSGLAPRDWLRQRKTWLAALAAVALIGGAALFLGGKGLSGYGQRDFTPAQRLLTQPRVVLWYASVWLFPAPQRLSLEHDFPVSRSPWSPLDTLPAAAVLLGLTIAAVVNARRAPLLCLGWLWFVGGLALESSILPLEMVFEHRLYLPGIGLGLCAADLLRRAGARRPHGAGVILLLGLLAAASGARARAWTDDLAVWTDAAVKAPGVSRSWANLCAVRFSRGDSLGAASACSVAVRIDPRDANAQFNLGLAFLAMEQFKAADGAFSDALAVQPGWAEAYYQRGRARARLGRDAEAEADLVRATAIESGDPIYWYQLAAIRLSENKIDAGRQALAEARRNLDRADPDLRDGLEQAIRTLEERAGSH